MASDMAGNIEKIGEAPADPNSFKALQDGTEGSEQSQDAKFEARFSRIEALLEQLVAQKLDETPRIERADSARIAALEAKYATMAREASHDESNEKATAYHRADAVYQMLCDKAPLELPGESARSYRERLAGGLRRYSDEFKDSSTSLRSLDPTAFALVEDRIYADAAAAAKTEIKGDTGRLREVVKHENGKIYRRFYGDSAAAWAPFAAPRMRFSFNHALLERANQRRFEPVS